MKLIYYDTGSYGRSGNSQHLPAEPKRAKQAPRKRHQVHATHILDECEGGGQFFEIAAAGAVRCQLAVAPGSWERALGILQCIPGRCPRQLGGPSAFYSVFLAFLHQVPVGLAGTGFPDFVAPDWCPACGQRRFLGPRCTRPVPPTIDSPIWG